jgi:hypothetical protein
MKTEILFLAENLSNFQFYNFFPTGYGCETVEFGGCKLAYFHCIEEKDKNAIKLDQIAVSKLKLFQTILSGNEKKFLPEVKFPYS